MPDLVRLEDVRGLVERREGPCVSVFMPMHRAAPERDQDPIRLKNLLTRADALLQAAGMRPPEARELLEPARGLLSDPLSWRNGNDGLAVFLDRHGARTLGVGLELPELVVVGERYHVKPLLPLFTADGTFRVLALSRGDVRLFEASRQRIRPIDLGRAPTSREEALRYDDLEKQHLLHVAGRGAPLFHGHGIGDEVERTLDERFLRMVDDGVLAALPDRSPPLVLAGVEEIAAVYREVTRYPNVLRATVPGNPDPLRPAELHARAWAIVEPELARAREEAAARFRAGAARGELATDDLGAAVAAADAGRVDTLFVASGVERWGRLDRGTGAVVVHDDQEPGDDDLLDLAAVRTLLTSGTVYAVPSDEVPGGTDVAATFRY
ncbi:MAG TPA: hypothetical protein VF044_01260 [Actinomycetota bacterium]